MFALHAPGNLKFPRTIAQKYMYVLKLEAPVLCPSSGVNTGPIQ